MAGLAVARCHAKNLYNETWVVELTKMQQKMQMIKTVSFSFFGKSNLDSPVVLAGCSGVRRRNDSVEYNDIKMTGKSTSKLVNI